MTQNGQELQIVVSDVARVTTPSTGVTASWSTGTIIYTGVARKANGVPIDSVVAFYEDSKELIATATPNAAGKWYLPIPVSTSFYLAYFNIGCAPIMHGPYNSGS